MKKKCLYLEDIASIEEGWKKEIFNEFYQTMTSEDIKFPCIFGSAGVKTSQDRYYFSDSESDEPEINSLAKALEQYLKKCKSYGNNTSLITFFKPSESCYSLKDPLCQDSCTPWLEGF